MGLAAGSRLGPYEIQSPIGAGGMGEVYKAKDTRLDRSVAIKVLPPEFSADPDRRTRFEREAKTIAGLNHPHICTLYDVGEHDGATFLVMEHLAGETLADRLAKGPLPLEQVLTVATEIADALSAAHRQGVIHRDLKPGNVMLTKTGAKLLDFGLAKLAGHGDQPEQTELASAPTRSAPLTRRGAILGTLPYMAPEQLQGEEVDARADIWAFGVMAYEMLGGHVPFKGADTTAVLVAVLTETPVALRKLRPHVPGDFARIVDEALEKKRERRTITAGDIVTRLSALNARSNTSGLAMRAQSLPRRLVGNWMGWALAVSLVAVVALTWYVREGARARWAREHTVPEIERLVSQEKYVDAFRLANEARAVIPSDPVWNRLVPLLSRTATITTTPPGASVYYREYSSGASQWIHLGESPLTDVRIPNAFFAWKVEKSGYVTAEDAAGQYSVITPARPRLRFALHDSRSTPAGMVHVTAPGTAISLSLPGLDHLPGVTVRDFWIDRYEVTNREFKRFVDAGGYRTPTFWRYPFVVNGQALTFDRAIRQFHDSTGRPGPATWELGRYPEGQDDYPVGGVSWYEAAAYAAFVGESLPTIYQWTLVADQPASAFIVPRSNFGGRGPTKVGASGGMNRFGAYDMAGNLKEWCRTSAGASNRYILGGGWDEPFYMFNDPDAQSPFARRLTYGFRCVKASDDEPAANADDVVVAFESRDFNKETPVTDAVFDAYRGLYAYDKVDLKAVVESVDNGNPDWRRENVSFTAGYGGERVPAAVFLPKVGRPPFQAVVVFPGSGALQMNSSSEMDVRRFEWIMKSGRVAIQPVYRGTFERRDGLKSDYPDRSAAFRDHVIAWAREVSRAVDYLQTRDDIAGDRIAFVGFSWGAAMGPIYVALEPRFKAGVFVLGGFYLQHSPPEVDAFNFAPRVKIPVLMLNGRFDFYLPVDSSQLPMFRLLSVPGDQKRRVVYEVGHNIPRPDLIRESLDWLDRYLGPPR